eukprot:SAG31_NODE_31035_length_373_cov_0.751825_1_plen_64_part_01
MWQPRQMRGGKLCLYRRFFWRAVRSSCGCTGWSLQHDLRGDGAAGVQVLGRRGRIINLHQPSAL